ncbi:hypothetical protein C8J57DRAFT_469143 [Mycena rebaudengoi]|nr:hypothetical protein C8J57DRAFT_469143 [Mycena rebaudengoi]
MRAAHATDTPPHQLPAVRCSPRAHLFGSWRRIAPLVLHPPNLRSILRVPAGSSIPSHHLTATRRRLRQYFGFFESPRGGLHPQCARSAERPSIAPCPSPPSSPPRAAAFNAPLPFTFIRFFAILQPASQRRDLPAALRAAQSRPSPRTPTRRHHRACFFLRFFAASQRRDALALRSAAHRATLFLFIRFSASPPPAPLRFDAAAARSAVSLRPSPQAPAQRPQSACGAARRPLSFYSIFRIPAVGFSMSRCLGGAHRPSIASESSRACAASSPRRPRFFQSIFRRPRGRSALRRFRRPPAPLYSRPTLRAPVRRYQRGAGLAYPPAYIRTNCAESLLLDFFFRCAASVHLHDRHALSVPNSCASPPTRIHAFRNFSLLRGSSTVNFPIFSSLRGLDPARPQSYESLAVNPRAARRTIVQAHELRDAAHSNSVVLSEDAFTDLHARSSSLEIYCIVDRLPHALRSTPKFSSQRHETLFLVCARARDAYS